MLPQRSVCILLVLVSAWLCTLSGHLECVLYNRSADGGSSGAIWKLLNQNGLGSTALQVNVAAVANKLLTQAEYDIILAIYKQSTPGLDPCSVGRIRSCTLIPISTAAAVRLPAMSHFCSTIVLCTVSVLDWGVLIADCCACGRYVAHLVVLTAPHHFCVRFLSKFRSHGSFRNSRKEIKRMTKWTWSSKNSCLRMALWRQKIARLQVNSP